jgi:hypothetical protein
MDDTSKLRTPAALVLAAGGFSWTTTIAVIAATDGANDGIPDTVTAVLWTAGALLMAVGTAATIVAALHRRHVALRVLGGLIGPVVWAVTYLVIEGIAQGVVGNAGPAWMHDEIGILCTGVALMTTGLWLARPRTPAGAFSFS